MIKLIVIALLLVCLAGAWARGYSPKVLFKAGRAWLKDKALDLRVWWEMRKK